MPRLDELRVERYFKRWNHRTRNVDDEPDHTGRRRFEISWMALKATGPDGKPTPPDAKPRRVYQMFNSIAWKEYEELVAK